MTKKHRLMRRALSTPVLVMGLAALLPAWAAQTAFAAEPAVNVALAAAPPPIADVPRGG